MAFEQWDCTDKGTCQNRVVLDVEYEAILLHIPVFYSGNDAAASKAFLNQASQALNIPIHRRAESHDLALEDAERRATCARKILPGSRVAGYIGCVYNVSVQYQGDRFIMRIRSDGEQTRAKILEAACAAFGDKGYHKATFAEIGRRGAFSPALISFHFRSKDDLYQMVWSTLATRVHERWPVDGGLPADAPAEARLRAHVEASLNRSCDPDLASLHRIHMQEGINPTGLLNKEVRDHRRENQRHMRTLLQELLGDEGTEVEVDLCEMSVVNQFAVLRPPRPGRGHRGHHSRYTQDDVSRLTDHITTFCLGGVAAIRRTIEQRKGQASS
jgi:AcrR family transcriptional regulator